MPDDTTDSILTGDFGDDSETSSSSQSDTDQFSSTNTTSDSSDDSTDDMTRDEFLSGDFDDSGGSATTDDGTTTKKKESDTEQSGGSESTPQAGDTPLDTTSDKSGGSDDSGSESTDSILTGDFGGEESGGPQTPKGSPPEPENGPSPDTGTEGPGAPDFDGSEPSGTTDSILTGDFGSDDKDSGPQTTRERAEGRNIRTERLENAESRQELKERAAEEFSRTTPNFAFSSEQIELQETDNGVRPTLSESAVEKTKEYSATWSIERSFGIDADKQDVDVSDGNVDVSGGTQQRVERSVIAQLDEQNPEVDITRENVNNFERTDDGIRPELDTETKRQLIATQEGVSVDRVQQRQDGQFVIEQQEVPGADDTQTQLAETQGQRLQNIDEEITAERAETEAERLAESQGDRLQDAEEMGGLPDPTQEVEKPVVSSPAEESIETLTSGGFLSESTEEDLSQLSRQYSAGTQYVGGMVGGAVDTAVRPVTGEEGETTAGAFTEGATRSVGELGNIPAFVGAGESAAEATEGTVKLIQQGEGEEAARAGYTVAESAVKAAARQAQENPAKFTGSVAGGVAGSVALGVGLGKAARFGRQRVRTAGSKTFDVEGGEIVNRETGEFYNPRADTPEEAFTSEQGGRFPGAQDPPGYRQNPAQAVRTQAEDYTPESVEARFQEAGVTEGVTLKKTLDVEPDGPGARRSGGFETQEGSYESPGSFMGSEISPNFLGEVNRQSSVSLRPGLPDTGDQATGIFVRTRVKEPDAENLDEFNQELLEREGETTARTKPASEVNEGEIEAVVPPEAEFADIGSRGPITDAARRAGIGSDFSVRFGGYRIPGTDRKIGGKKVPLRPVADPDLMESRSIGSRFRQFMADETAQLGKRADTDIETRQLSEIQRAGTRPVDRPAPYTPSTPSSPSSRGPANTDALNETPTTSDSDRRRDDEEESMIPGSSPFDSSPIESDGPSSPTGSDTPSDGPEVSPPGSSPPSDPDSPTSGTPTETPPTSTGTPTTTTPPMTPPNKSPRSPRINLEIDSDKSDDEGMFAGVAEAEFTDFLNPLTGEVIKTERQS